MGTNLGPNILDVLFFCGILICTFIGLYKLFLNDRALFLKKSSIIIVYIGLWIFAIKMGNMFLIVLCCILAFPFFLFLWSLAEHVDD